MMPSRRTTIQWMMTAAMLPMARWSPPAMAATLGDTASSPPPFKDIAGWPDVPPPAQVAGYGRDPDLMKPEVPWPLTLGAGQRKTVDLLGDLILPKDAVSPGAGTLGVGAFVDEWISAPYPIQREDRERVIGGLIWLDAQSRLLHGQDFAGSKPSQQAALLDAMSVPVPIARMVAPVAFMDTLRKLFVMGFYSLPEGKADMGYIGEQPIAGPYPGPTPEALAHFSKTVGQMGLRPSKA